mmetsp:Transcript_103938/g.294494  ORF Transcript_103938/g.294494 Transcript_103938/m.294494 type:complete len:324 (+) Transcript_103938:88-1059(+)
MPCEQRANPRAARGTRAGRQIIPTCRTSICARFETVSKLHRPPRPCRAGGGSIRMPPGAPELDTDGGEPGRQEVGVEEHLRDAGPLPGLHLQALPDQVPHPAVADAVQLGDEIGAQEPRDLRRGQAGEVLAPGRELVHEHPEAPDVVAFFHLELIAVPSHVGVREFRWARLWAIIQRGSSLLHDGLKVDPLHPREAPIAHGVCHHDEILSLEVCPNQIRGVHRPDALHQGHGRLPQRLALQALPAAGSHQLPQVALARLQNQGTAASDTLPGGAGEVLDLPDEGAAEQAARDLVVVPGLPGEPVGVGADLHREPGAGGQTPGV